MDLFFPSQELEPDNRTKNDSRVHTCNLEKKILCIFNVFHDSSPWLQFLLPGSFLRWMKEVSSSSSSSSSSSRFYSFCSSSDLRKAVPSWIIWESERLLEARSVYIGCGKRLPGLYAFEGLYALKSDEYVNSIVFLLASGLLLRLSDAFELEHWR